MNLYIPDTYSNAYFSLIPSGVLKLPVILYMSITAAVVEEIIYRGLLLILLKDYIDKNGGKLLYILASAILFSSVHWENGVPDLAQTFVLGLLSAMLYLKLRNLLPFIFAHFIGDMVSFW